MHFSSGCDDFMQLTLRSLDGRHLAAKSIIIFVYIFCNAEFDRSAHTGIGENRKLLGNNKRTTPTREVERPVYTTVVPIELSPYEGFTQSKIEKAKFTSSPQ